MGWIISDVSKAFPFECPYCGCGHSYEQETCDRCGKIVKSFKNPEPAPIEKWREAFARTLAIAIDKDYFDEINFLYPDGAPRSEDGEEDYEAVWYALDEAFYKIFGVDRHKLY